MNRATGHYEDTDLAMFAMQLLHDEGHDATAEHVRDCVFCRQELARLQGDLAACAYGVEMYAPAASVRERLMARVGREKKAVAPKSPDELSSVAQQAPLPMEQEDEELRLTFRTPSSQMEEEPQLQFRRHSEDAEPELRIPERRRSDDVERPERQSGTRVRGPFAWMGWALSAAFAVGGVRLYQRQMDYRTKVSLQAAEITELSGDASEARTLMGLIKDPSAQRFLLVSPEANSGSMAEAHVIYQAEKGSLILLADHLAPLGIDKTYEFWLIPADSGDPVPAGTFRPDASGNGSVILPPLSKAVAVKAFGITIEDGAGSQSPTMPIVLAGS